MNLNLQIFCLACPLVLWVHTLNGQVNPSVELDLDLEDSGQIIENVVLLELSEKKVKALHSTRGRKMEFSANEMIINGDTLKPKKLRTRGQSTLMFERKSLQIKLKSKAIFLHGEKVESLKKFYLLNLAMDKYYCHNRLAFELMDSAGLFGLFYSFGELRINGNSEGIFMIIERPEDWAFHEKDAPFILRRGPEHSIEEMKTSQSGDRGTSKKYMDLYRKIYAALDHYSGKDLFEVLSESFDIDHYMKWMAFNFLIHNGDYADEVFFYFDPEVQKFRIIPWDYDDIMAATPHEGIRIRNQLIGEKLIFSGEDILDKKIGTDPYLYGKYLEKLNEVLEILSPEMLRGVIERTYAELFPYYAHPEIISNVQLDYYKDANLNNLSTYLSQIYRLLLDYRDIYLDLISGSEFSRNLPVGMLKKQKDIHLSDNSANQRMK